MTDIDNPLTHSLIQVTSYKNKRNGTKQITGADRDNVLNLYTFEFRYSDYHRREDRVRFERGEREIVRDQHHQGI